MLIYSTRKPQYWTELARQGFSTSILLQNIKKIGGEKLQMFRKKLNSEKKCLVLSGILRYAKESLMAQFPG